MIRLASYGDMKAIEGIYEKARKYMEDAGNPTQWGKNHPTAELLEEDIKKERLYVDTTEPEDPEIEGEIIHGVFAFILGEDKTYTYIENGMWLNEKPYGTIHRIAGDGEVKGVFGRCFEFCRLQINNLRIDTHENNYTMRHLIEKYGFKKCGIVYMEDGSPRIAYQNYLA